MSQFPVENEAGLYEGINYLLSGPAGLGQNFQGFATFTPAYIRPTFRAPFTIPIDSTQNPNWYVSSKSIGNIVALDTNSFRVDYSALQVPAPFTTGDRVTISGVTDTGGETFNGTYTLLSGNTTSIVCGTTTAYSWATYISGGVARRNWVDEPTSTDCNALVTIYGPTDQAFITAQLNLDFNWTASTASEFDILVQINRYRAAPVIGQPGQFFFQFDSTISERRKHITSSTDDSDTFEAIFTTVLDSPGFGFYYYIMEVDFVTEPFYNSEQIGGDTVEGGLVADRFYYSGTLSSGQVPATEGDYNDYLGITPTTITGLGSGAVLDIELYNITGGSTLYNDQNTDVYIDTEGTGYQVGDIIKVLGTDLGGASPANDLTMEIVRVQYPGDAKPGSFECGLRSLTAQVIKE